LTAVADTVQGWCELSLNTDEFTHRFTIPTAHYSTYAFATTFASDHRVSIQPTGVDSFGAHHSLNEDHVEMLSCMKRRMRKMLWKDKSVSRDSLEMFAKKWKEIFWGDKSGLDVHTAAAALQLEKLLGVSIATAGKAEVTTVGASGGNVKPAAGVPSVSSNSEMKFTWRALLCAACYISLNI
jgi:hypothetical protein